jgi:uroporphyrinogen-III synthase
MVVLVTRPHPGNQNTASALRKRGFEVLSAPVLKFEAVPFHYDMDARCSAVIVTSANALLGIEPQLKGHRLLELPLFAVGDTTAEAARRAGFTHVISASGDAAALRDAVLASVEAGQLNKAGALLYLAGGDLARDLAGELGEHGLRVITCTTYRMVPLKGLALEVREAFAANRIEAVLHYSQRSARAFLDAARSDGVEISALSIVQCCMSDAVASVVREAGATQVVVAASPDEEALFVALGRALRKGSR